MKLRGFLSLGVALSAAALVPASSGAVVLGNPDMNYETSQFEAACGAPGPTCLFFQTKLPGAKVKAPFTGVIRKWGYAASGSYPGALVVLHKTKRGKFRLVDSTATEITLGAGTYQFDTHLRIKEGDYIAFHGTQLVGRYNADAGWKTINPAPLPGDSGKPGSPAHDELLYNARLKR